MKRTAPGYYTDELNGNKVIVNRHGNQWAASVIPARTHRYHPAFDEDPFHLTPPTTYHDTKKEAVKAAYETEAACW